MKPLMTLLLGGTVLAAIVYAGTEPRARANAAPADLSTLVEQVSGEVTDYQQKNSTLSSTDASRQWLALFDKTSAVWLRARHAPASTRKRVDELTRQLFTALPPPTAWSELSKRINNRPAPEEADGSVREQALRVLANVLTNDQPNRAKVLQSLRDAAGSDDAVAGVGAAEAIASIDQLIGEVAEGRGRAQLFEKELELFGDDAGETLDVPDLYRLTDQVTAEALARAAVAAAARLELPGGDYTDKRLIALALRHVESMKMPHFELVRDESAIELYDAMERRFPSDRKTQREREARGEPSWDQGKRLFDRYKARRIALASQIRAGKQEDALRTLGLLRSLDVLEFITAGEIEPSADLLSDMEWDTARFDTVLALLKAHPEAPLWELASRGAIHLKRVPEWVAMAEKVTADQAPSELLETPIGDLIVQTLLRSGPPGPALDRRRPVLDIAPGDATSDDVFDVTYIAELSPRGDARPSLDWLRAVAAHRFKSAQPDDADAVESLVDDISGIADALVVQGQAPEAVSLLLKSTHVQVQAELNPTRSLTQALAIYLKAGQPARARELLDTADLWSYADLVDVPRDQSARGRLFGDLAGTTLVRTGKRTEGLAALRWTLRQYPEELTAYPALVEAGLQADSPKAFDEAMAVLDELIAWQPRSPTPLAWKGELLRRAGKLDQAETAAVAAIAMGVFDEPIPGEKHLLQAHRTLHQVLTAQGRGREAAEYAPAITAADKLAAAENLTPNEYFKSLSEAAETFPQWTALRLILMEMQIDCGNTAEARRHAEAAVTQLLKTPLEKLPIHQPWDSAFSHRLFRSEVLRLAQAKLDEEPGDARASYLLGQAHDQAGHSAEAAVLMSGATLHQPGFAGAWSWLQHYGATVRSRSEAALRLLSLPGQDGYDFGDTAEVVDLAGLWTAVSRRKPDVAPLQIYPLGGAAIDGNRQPEATESPGDLLLQTPLMGDLRDLMFPSLPEEL